MGCLCLALHHREIVGDPKEIIARFVRDLREDRLHEAMIVARPADVLAAIHGEERPLDPALPFHSERTAV